MKYSVFALSACALAAALFAAEATEPKTIPADKLSEFNKSTIKLQGAQLRYFSTKEQIEEQKKKFEKEAGAELEKLIKEAQSANAEFTKTLEALRKDAGAGPDCMPDESGKWNCPKPAASK